MWGLSHKEEEGEDRGGREGGRDGGRDQVTLVLEREDGQANEVDSNRRI